MANGEQIYLQNVGIMWKASYTELNKQLNFAKSGLTSLTLIGLTDHLYFAAKPL